MYSVAACALKKVQEMMVKEVMLDRQQCATCMHSPEMLVRIFVTTSLVLQLLGNTQSGRSAYSQAQIINVRTADCIHQECLAMHSQVSPSNAQHRNIRTAA